MEKKNLKVSFPYARKNSKVNGLKWCAHLSRHNHHLDTFRSLGTITLLSLDTSVLIKNLTCTVDTLRSGYCALSNVISFCSVSPCLLKFFAPLSNEQKKISKLYMPNLLQCHQCCCSFIITGVTLYKEHDDPCEEYRRYKYHTNSEKMQVTEWLTRESHSCLPGMQITYGHTIMLTNKAQGNWTNVGKGTE